MMPKNGTVPGEDFDMGKLDPAAAKASKGVPEATQEKVMGHFKRDETGYSQFWEFDIFSLGDRFAGRPQLSWRVRIKQLRGIQHE
jgi:hypothetical protein